MTIPQGFEFTGAGWYDRTTGRGPYSYDGTTMTLMGGGGGGSGGGPATIADGADVSQGARADAAATTDTGTFSVVSLIKRGLQNWTTLLARIPSLVGGRIPVEPLGIPGVARQLAAGSATANTVLTVGVGRISIHARGADIRYVVGSSAQTASATSHFIASGERLDIDVPATPNIAVIRAGSVDGTLELTELA